MSDTDPGAALLRAFVQQLLAPAIAEAVAGQTAATDDALQRLAEGMAEMTAEMQAMRQEMRAALAPEPEAPPVSAPIVVEPEPPAPVVVTPTPDIGSNQVEITGANGAIWTLDLSVVPSEGPWPGAYGDQWRATAEVPAVYVGSTSLRVVVDWGTAANGVPWADVWLRNDITMREGGGPASYSVRVVLDGQEALRQDVPRHQQYRAWGRLVSAGPMPEVELPTREALAKAGVANYAGPVNADVLDRYVAAMATWGDDIWSPRGVALDMFGTGGRDDIGPVTAPQAIALMTRDARMRAYVVGQAEAAGTIPWHFWDAEASTWISVQRYPRLWADWRGKAPGDTALLQPQPGDTGWQLDIAHQPGLSFVAWLMTGRRAFRDNHAAQAAWTILAQQPETRGDSDMLVVNGGQVRGSAWALRQIDEAAWASPEGSAEKAYFTAVAEANWSWIVDNIPIWTQQQGEAHGWLPGEYGTEGALPPWQQDYFASTAIAAARRGNADAVTYLRWASNFLVGRFKALGHDGAAYLLVISEGSRILATWAEIKAKTAARGWSNGAGWGKNEREGNYSQWARATLAGLADLLGDTEARRLYDWLPAEGAPFTQSSDYARDPLLSIAAAQ
jgi:hypothetical protein